MKESLQEQEDFLLASYQYDLPTAQIAQFPTKERGSSRLMVLRRGPKNDYPPAITHATISELANFLPKGALLVANNSKVMPARLLGTLPSGGKLEVLLLSPLPLLKAKPEPCLGADYFSAEAEVLTRSSARLKIGAELEVNPRLKITILKTGPFGRKEVRLTWQGDLTEIFNHFGHMPLPPYIKREDQVLDQERYQTIYAKQDKNGSVAAPTAGLHLTFDLKQKIMAAGVSWAEVTLYVGYGTFSPVRTSDIREHKMHREYFEISPETAKQLAKAKQEGRPIIALGTTTVRALEGMMSLGQGIIPYQGATELFLYPGLSPKLVDGLLTNFHLPASSLIMLVANFAGRKRLLAAYEEAVQQGYRFFSYGDAMLLLP